MIVCVVDMFFTIRKMLPAIELRPRWVLLFTLNSCHPRRPEKGFPFFNARIHSSLRLKCLRNLDSRVRENDTVNKSLATKVKHWRSFRRLLCLRGAPVQEFCQLPHVVKKNRLVT